ncbi:hypothetical protein [Flavobacterium sp. HNIBRBA15423]|uniref:hypothetical protein n=1 Tax=Flavobacterium sp. HNIBRBA15423 TaxID=3458683 RepID=UPI0040441348
MSHKIEVISLSTAALASTFTNDLFSKIIISTISMIIATTAAYYWRRYLEKKNKKNE